MKDAEARAHTSNMRYGSKPWRYDPRDKGFSHKKFFGAANLALLPRGGLLRPRRPVENQLYTLRCTAYATAMAGGYLHGLRFSPDYQAIQISRIQGRPIDENGADPKSAMKSAVAKGFLLYDQAPKTLERDGQQLSSAERYWPETLDERAEAFKALAYLTIDDAGDYFDDIRWALYTASQNKTLAGGFPVVHAFSRWYAEWNNPGRGIVPETPGTFVGNHAYVFIDWITINGIDYLVAQNSAGPDMGDHGYLYFSRAVVNREFAAWGAALKILKPMSPEQIETAKREDAFGYIQRLIIEAWYRLSDAFGHHV